MLTNTNHESQQHDLCSQLSPRESFGESRKVGAMEFGLFCRLSTSNVNFFMLTKRWVPILLSKFSENCAVLGKW